MGVPTMHPGPGPRDGLYAPLGSPGAEYGHPGDQYRANACKGPSTTSDESETPR